MALARFGTLVARQLVEVRHDLAALDSGFWAVVVTFEGEITALRFADVDNDESPGDDAPAWLPPSAGWTSTLDRTAYQRGVAEIRDRIAAGEVYQVNLCRVLSAPLPPEAELAGLAALLEAGNPAPHAAFIDVPECGIQIVSASPETYLTRSRGRLASRPIKGTAKPGEAMADKDVAENVMIVDLVRNDLAPVCVPGTVDTEELCVREPHPGLDHLVSTVAGRLREDATWGSIFAASFPPGSVSGAPKVTALQAIHDLEPAERGPYCGAIGWIDADQGRAELAVGIRTFWVEADRSGQRWLRFGTGAGITWGSDPQQEWEESELKTSRLIGLASGKVTP